MNTVPEKKMNDMFRKFLSPIFRWNGGWCSLGTLVWLDFGGWTWSNRPVMGNKMFVDCWRVRRGLPFVTVRLSWRRKVKRERGEC